MKKLSRLSALFVLAAVLLSGCWRRHGHAIEAAYVSAPQAILRDHMSAVFNKTGVVKNGDRVEVLEKDRRFARIRTAKGEEGWIEQRYLVSQQVFDGFQKLAQQEQNDPQQAAGTTRNDTNLHLTPGRDTDHLFQLNEGAKLALMKRATVDKVLPGGVKPTVEDGKAVPMEDWWLIRDAQGHVGWVLARMIDVDVPLEIAEYAEGQRMVSVSVLDQVPDGDKKVPQYVVALTEPKDGLPFDFNQVRVFTWNVKRHRYETAYREHDLNGVLPLTVAQENFDKEGVLPVFIVRVKDDAGNVSERKYKLNTPIVKRVLAPGEAPSPAHQKSRHPVSR